MEFVDSEFECGQPSPTFSQYRALLSDPGVDETGPHRSGVNKSQPVRAPLRDVTNDNALGLEHPPSAYGIRAGAPAVKSHSRTVTSKRRTPGREFLLTIDILE
ncbi:hypothetical protein EVAR_22416_1 [Eumeta japonica]|uniref:Uncharacterized protein n=1 Tax=Eumeta variegata TaxID=151549 RepID=A0A4C1SH48_EUMVA|nr:hypothetical protein EVAR_22416_1 [Eumeta japonica]